MIKANIGCGKRNFGEDWIHIDGNVEYSHVESGNIFLDHYGNETFDLIYASHLIAYFDQKEVITLIESWKRALKKGGILRIATPDLTAISKLVHNGIDANEFIGPIYGHMTMGDSDIYHKCGYTYQSICDLLEVCGFKSVHKYDFRRTEHSQFDDHSKAHYPNDEDCILRGKFTGKKLISLNVEATK